MGTFRLSLFSILIASAFSTQANTEFKGKGSLYFAHFPDSPSISQQSTNYSSVALNADILHTFDNSDKLSLKLFTRAGDKDEIRNTSDIREAFYLSKKPNWQLGAGLKTESWGVSNISRPTNVINPTDTAEGVKLALLMVKYSLLSKSGNVDFYVLPQFRKRVYANLEGRPGIFLPILSDNSTFESPDKENNIDFAIRWSHSINKVSFALSHFSGTSRDADLVAGDFVSSKPTSFTPHYPLITQTGLELKYKTNNTIWTTELINRDSKTINYSAASLGLVSTIKGIVKDKSRLKFVTEYMWDSRVASIKNKYENDLYLGAKLALNDQQATAINSGFVFDLDSDEIVFRFKASRNMTNNFKITVDSRIYNNVEDDPFFKHFKQDSYIRTHLAYSF